MSHLLRSCLDTRNRFVLLFFDVFFRLNYVSHIERASEKSVNVCVCVSVCVYDIYAVSGIEE